MDWPDRRKVLIVGGHGFNEDSVRIPFEQRNLTLVRIEDKAMLSERSVLNEARAVIVSDFPKKFALIKECYSKFFPKVQDCGLAVFVIAQDQSDFDQIKEIRPALVYNEQPSWIALPDEIWSVAERIARHKTGPPEGPLRDISGDIPEGTVWFQPDDIAQTLSEDDKLLLRRAFWDCNKLYLTNLTGGRASMGVYKVHAWFAEAVARPRPLPFFVKIGRPAVIEDEMELYRIYVEHYLPFNLRPQLAKGRCSARTLEKRALVGTFVDHAVDLRTALKTSQGIGALFSLFETSLRGFRAQPLVGNPHYRNDVLEGFVSAWAKLDSWISPLTDRVNLARRDFGLAQDPEWIATRLKEASKQLPCLVGPTHGDLHYGNVMVRGIDAVVIDFGSIKDGPLTSDPAALEVSLMFGTDDTDKSEYFDEWRAFIDEIYGMTIENLHPPALFESQPGDFSWLRRALRELRHVLLACNEKNLEAKIVLAAYLLRYARLPIEHLNNSGLENLAIRRHAYALVIAERIATGLQATTTTLHATNEPKGF